MQNTNNLINWSITPPTFSSWGWATYDLNKELKLYKTCKRGCCADCGFGPMVLPNYCKSATPEEGIAEEARWATLPSLNFF